jgi:succinylglutamate desuccinylase
VQDLSHFTQFLDVDLARLLAERFSHMETHYTSRLHSTFRGLRHERAMNLQHFAKIRKSFLRYLRRADNKMNVLEAFTIHYNDIKQAHRMDPHCKEELHQRVDELADQLWDITDARKTESETELTNIKSDGIVIPSIILHL